MKIYGPYVRKQDGRKFIVEYEEGSRKNKKSAKLYSRYLMEQKLGRKLTQEETVDHKDNDKTNDSIDNLQILTRVENAKKDHKKTEWFYFDCPVCKKPSKRSMSQIRRARKKGKAGPYCSKSCAGKRHN